MTRCESYPPCFGTIYFPTAPFVCKKKYSEFIDNPLVVTLIAKLFKINLAVKITTRRYCNRNYL